MSTKSQTVVLLDAHSIIHRAYHALPNFSNSKGEPTGALYGLVSMLVSIIKELKPDYIIAAYDLPHKTQRHDMFDKYKAGRKETDSELKIQLEKSRDLLKDLSIPIYDQKGYEADDIIGTIANSLKDKYDIVIASGDLDMLQLVDDKKVRVFTLKKGITDTILYDEEAVKARFGFGPEYIVDYKALQGDASDNIPGVKGVGAKTATDLIMKFGHLENIYDKLESGHLENIKPRVVKLLEEDRDNAFFSKTLATILLDAPIDIKLPSQPWRESVNADKVIDTFNKLEFRTLIPRFKALLGENKTNQENIDTNSMEFKETSIALWLVRSDIIDPKPDDIFNFSGTNSFVKARKIIFDVLKDRELEFVFENIEKPLIPIIDKMNNTGIKLDTLYLSNLSKKYTKTLNKIRNDIFQEVGKEFNLNSPMQLADVLVNDLNITGLKKTATGRVSTKESELEKIKDKHPIINKILSYRELQKLLSTYIDNLPKMVRNGRLYTKFIQAGTTTGRMASQHPNLQNIPIRTDLGRAVRYGFVAETGYRLVSFDYSQIELRIAGILSNDEKLINAFKNRKDIHTSVAMEVFSVDEKDVTSDMRRKAKAINFGILYGMGVNALKKSLGDVTLSEAKKFLNTYFEKYSGLAEWIDKTKAEASRRGYTTTLFGRRRYFEGVNSSIPYIRAQAERMAINAPIQGTQADIIKMAMRKIDDFLNAKYGKNQMENARLVLQIHDELIYEIKEDEVSKIDSEICQIMENVLSEKESRGVPIVVDVKSGVSWGDL